MSISESIRITKRMGILALHVSASTLHFSIRCFAGSSGCFGLFSRTETGRWSFFAHSGGITSTSGGNVATAAENTDMYVQFKPGLNLSVGGWCSSPSAWPDSVCLHGPKDAFYAEPCLQERMRLRCSLQLWTLLPPPGNVRKANTLFWEEAEFLVVQQAEVVSNRLSQL